MLNGAIMARPAIPLLNELLLTQIDFRITGCRCLGVWVDFFFFSFPENDCQSSFPFQLSGLLEWHRSYHCQRYSAVRTVTHSEYYRHFSPQRAPMLLLLAVRRLPSAISGSGGPAAVELARLLPAFCCTGHRSLCLLQAASCRVVNATFFCFWGKKIVKCPFQHFFMSKKPNKP